MNASLSLARRIRSGSIAWTAVFVLAFSGQAFGQTTPTLPSAGASATSAADAPKVEPVRATKEWNLSKAGVAIAGYDPVAYFPEGGSSAKKGDMAVTTTYKGATYRFVSTENRDRFLADPAKYEPAHGGWCSWAMKEGDKVDVDPASFIVKEGRLFLFYKGWLGDTRAKWLKEDHAAEAKLADSEWKKVSGEESRKPKAEPEAESQPKPSTPDAPKTQP